MITFPHEDSVWVELSFVDDIIVLILLLWLDIRHVLVMSCNGQA